EDGIRDDLVTGVQTCALPISAPPPRGELAALWIRLAQLRLERLDDKAGAKAAVDEALALVPEHPTALAVLAAVASPDDDPRAFRSEERRVGQEGRSGWAVGAR